MPSARVLVVSANPALADGARSALQVTDADVRIETDSLAGLVAVELWQPAVVVLDWNLPLISGAVFVSAVTTHLVDPPSLIALANPEATDEATASGATAVLSSSPQCDGLADMVKRTLRSHTSVDG